jgi:hypothetical protein
VSTHARYRRIPLDDLLVVTVDGAPLNPRGEVATTTDLQASLQVVGQIEPILVEKRNGDGKHPILDGHRRAVAFRLLRDAATTDEERERWSSIWAVERSPQAPLIGAMLATNVREQLKPTRVGQGIIDLTVEHSWTLAKAAATLGMTVGEAEHYVRAAHAPANVKRRLDSGELAWTTWTRRVSKLPAAMQDEIAAMEQPTNHRVQKLMRERTQPAERLVDDETLVEQANDARAIVEALLDAQPWGPDVAPRLQYVLEQIGARIAEALHHKEVNTP